MFLHNILLSGCNQKQMNQVLRQYLSLETKIEEYDNVLNNEHVYFLKNKSTECLLYLKKIQ